MSSLLENAQRRVEATWRRTLPPEEASTVAVAMEEALAVLSAENVEARCALLMSPMFVALADAPTAQLWASLLDVLGSADVDSLPRLRSELLATVSSRAGDAILAALDGIGGTGSSGNDGDGGEARCDGRASTTPLAGDGGSVESMRMAQRERCTTLCSAAPHVCCEERGVL